MIVADSSARCHAGISRCLPRLRGDAKMKDKTYTSYAYSRYSTARQ